jgi:hypothetical protein
MVRAPLIIFVEKEFSKKQKAVAALLDEVSSVKQSQCMYYNNLAKYIHEYKEIHDQSTQINCEQFEEKIQELKISIHEDIANLVIKTITLKVLKAEMKDLKKDISVLMDRAKIAESYRQTLCDLWDMATKIAKLV